LMGALSAVVLTAGLGWLMSAQADPPKPDPKPAEPNAPPPGFRLELDLDDILKGLPPEIDKESLRKALEMHKQMLKDGQFGQFGNFGQMGRFGFVRPEEGRLGIHTSKPSETLAEQLDLPKGQGLVVEEVVADSAAAKAGIKAHDVLLEIDGKAVSDNPRELRKALAEIKADTAVDVVVLRKGKKETIKGVKLPEAKPANANFPNFGGFQGVPGNFNFQFQFPGGFGAGGAGTMTSVVRNGDEFQVKQMDNGLMVSVKGTVAGGKATPSEIQVSEPGKEPQKFDSLDKVPETYKDKVKSLLDIAEKGKVEIKKP